MMNNVCLLLQNPTLVPFEKDTFSSKEERKNISLSNYPLQLQPPKVSEAREREREREIEGERDRER